ncbi:T9SS type A sorting domain-containing protein [Nonlabens sp. Asnod3-A02]|uniref:T9SS type A sorting domain-containing protein n=1 Tax=Nonlabens sp. Asnod3-A02 TaxID=3160579 RepID=UPI003865179E
MNRGILKAIILMVMTSCAIGNTQVWSNAVMAPMLPSGADNVNISIDLVSDTDPTYDSARSGIFYCLGAGCDPLTVPTGIRAIPEVLPLSTTDGLGTYSGTVPPYYGTVRWVARKVSALPSERITDSPVQEYTTPLPSGVRVEMVTASALEGDNATDGGTLVYRFVNTNMGVTTINYSVSGTANTIPGEDIVTNLTGTVTTGADGVALLNVAINGDDVFEHHETIVLSIVPDTSYVVDLNYNSATGTIIDDEVGSYVYRNDTMGWINDPTGADGGRPSSMQDVVIIEAGSSAGISGFLCRDLIINDNGTLNVSSDVHVGRDIILGDNTAVLGSGYLVHGDRNDVVDAVLRSTATSFEISLSNYRTASDRNQILWLGAVSGQTVLNVAGEIDLAGNDVSTSGDVLGKVVFKSNAVHTAQIVGDGSFNPNPLNGIEVERYISGNRAFRFLTSPVSGESLFDTWQEGGNTPVGYGMQITGVLGSLNEVGGPADAVTGLDFTTTGNPSAFEFNGGSWNAVTNTKTTLHSVGKAYRVLVRGDRNLDLNNNSSGQDMTTTLRATGVLEQEDVSLPLAAGFNLVGNPYQSKMDLGLATSATAIGFAYYWDPTLGTRGAYTTITLPSGSATGASLASNVLEPGQSFFIEALTPGTIDFHIDDKVSLTDAGIFSAPVLDNMLTIDLYETSRYMGNLTAQDGVLVRFSNVENPAIDERDAVKFSNLDETLSIVSNLSNLAIESRLFPVNADVIPLSITNYKSTNYTLAIKMEAVPGVNAYLRDNFAGTITAISYGVNNAIDFIVDPAEMEGRFELFFENVTLSNESVTDAVVSVYPNPVTGDVIHINTGNIVSEKWTARLFNSLGQEILKEELDVNQQTLSLSNMSSIRSGWYILQVEGDDNVFTEKIMIQ